MLETKGIGSILIPIIVCWMDRIVVYLLDTGGISIMKRIVLLLVIITSFLMSSVAFAQSQSYLFLISEKGKFGYIDEYGKVVVKPTYDDAEEFSEGLAAVKVGDVWGYINGNGEMDIEPQFEQAWPFSEGLAYTSVRNYGQLEYIDKSGEFAFFPDFDDSQSIVFSPEFSEGLVPIWDNNKKWGYFNNFGQLKIKLAKLEVENALSFSEGLAFIKVNNKWGCIDKDGDIIVKPKFENHTDVSIQYIKFNNVGFSEGMAHVKVKEKWGYINKNGDIVVEPRFDLAYPFSEGLAKVSMDTNRARWGYINNAGQLAIIPKFWDAGNFSEGLAYVRIKGKYGFINKGGKLQVRPQYTWAEDFKNGLARVGLEESKNKWGYIDRAGEWIWKPIN